VLSQALLVAWERNEAKALAQAEWKADSRGSKVT
jgi:hypothetical protein